MASTGRDVWGVVMMTVQGDFLVLSVVSTEAACENMSGSFCICNVTSESLFLQSSITPGWGCCSGCWGSLPLQGQTLGLPGEWRYINMKKRRLSSLAHLYFTFYNVTLIYPDRIHWEVWSWTSVGRLQEEPQRRHSPTKDTQDLHCKISNWIRSV